MILSICLPTFNRSGYLKENLKVLLPQLLGYENDVELIISDNCSKDDTSSIVEQAEREHSFPIKYHYQEQAMSGEENFVWVSNQAKGKYLFVMGDDDVLSPDFIRIIMPRLKGGEDYVAIHWNRLSGDESCNNNILVDSIYTGEMEQIMCPDVFAMRVLEKPNFMSSIIFQKKILSLGKPFYEKDEYFGYRFFAQVYFGIVLSKGLCIYYYLPLVLQRNPSKTWVQYWPQYLISSSSNIFYDLDKMIPGIYAQWQKKLRKDVPKFIPSVANYRSYYNQPEIRSLMFKHLTKWESLLFYYYLIPGSFFLYRVKLKILKVVNKLLG